MGEDGMAPTMKLAAVTGAGQGLGRGIAVQLGEAGYELALLDRHDCDEKAELVSAAGATARAYSIDVADEASVARAFTQIDEHQVAVTALVNAAGIFLDALFLETTAE